MSIRLGPRTGPASSFVHGGECQLGLCTAVPFCVSSSSCIHSLVKWQAQKRSPSLLSGAKDGEGKRSSADIVFSIETGRWSESAASYSCLAKLVFPGPLFCCHAAGSAVAGSRGAKAPWHTCRLQGVQRLPLSAPRLVPAFLPGAAPAITPRAAFPCRAVRARQPKQASAKAGKLRRIETMTAMSWHSRHVSEACDTMWNKCAPAKQCIRARCRVVLRLRLLPSVLQLPWC